MKTHSGSIDIPHWTCQTLGQIRVQTGYEQVTAAELAKRVECELAHDKAATVAHAPTEAELDAEMNARAGLCPQCGELIGNVDRCPICGSPLWQEKISAAVGMVPG